MLFVSVFSRSLYLFPPPSDIYNYNIFTIALLSHTALLCSLLCLPIYPKLQTVAAKIYSSLSLVKHATNGVTPLLTITAYAFVSL